MPFAATSVITRLRLLLGLGKASIGDLTPDDIVVPPGFTRTLGGGGPVFDPAGSRQATTGQDVGHRPP